MPTSTEERLQGGQVSRATHLSSAQIRKEWTQKIKDESLFSARTTMKSYLDALKKRLVEVIGGTITPQESERKLKETLRSLGYSPERGFGDGKVPPARPGEMRDLSSSRRIQLIIDTNVKKARSMGQVAASENPTVLLADPAWKLTRTGARKKPRGNWLRRWAAAGAKCGWKGASKRQMVALKTSPIWEALGEGAGGFEDAIGSPYPPFAFGSGMAWVGVGRKEWQRICQAEGMKDGLGEIRDKARELAAVKPAPPAEPPKPKQADNPLTKQEPPKSIAPPPTPSYRPNLMWRNQANDTIDDCLDGASGFIDEMEAWLDRVGKMRSEAGGDLNAEESFTRYWSRIGDALADAKPLKGRLAYYGSAVETTPLPDGRARQMDYDLAMQRYDAAAKRVFRTMRSLRDRAEMQYMAAERTRPN